MLNVSFNFTQHNFLTEPQARAVIEAAALSSLSITEHTVEVSRGTRIVTVGKTHAALVDGFCFTMRASGHEVIASGCVLGVVDAPAYVDPVIAARRRAVDAFNAAFDNDFAHARMSDDESEVEIYRLVEIERFGVVSMMQEKKCLTKPSNVFHFMSIIAGEQEERTAKHQRECNESRRMACGSMTFGAFAELCEANETNASYNGLNDAWIALSHAVAKFA